MPAKRLESVLCFAARFPGILPTFGLSLIPKLRPFVQLSKFKPVFMKMRSTQKLHFLFFLPVGLLLLAGLPRSLWGQDMDYSADSAFIRQIHDYTLTESHCYDWLRHLTKDVGARLSGSPEAAAAVEYSRQLMESLGLDTVWLQPVMVPHWVRGGEEVVRIVESFEGGNFDLPATSLGNSVGTGPEGLRAEVISVQTLEEVEKLGRARVEGKIVFFDRPFDQTEYYTFRAYGKAVDQRVWGPSKAAEYGAVAVLVRSMTNSTDDVPHTGTLVYVEDKPKIPALAVSTRAADLLRRQLKQGKVEVYIRNHCKMLEPKLSYNVIGEIRGSEKPDEIIAVGGHLDSWDVGEGAHDDGAGCVQSMQVLATLKQLGYRPRRTLRCVLFMNEENGSAGAKTYRDVSNSKGEYHLAALESDSGGFTPRGFRVDGHEDIFDEKFARVLAWQPLLRHWRLDIRRGGSGADVSKLKGQKGLLFGLEPDSQRYFDYHHTDRDVFEAVNKRELELGAAAMTSLVYLLDKYGLN